MMGGREEGTLPSVSHEVLYRGWCNKGVTTEFPFWVRL